MKRISKINSMCELVRAGMPRQRAQGFGMDPDAPALLRAEGEFVAHCLAKINAGAANWRAYAWLLETRFPDEYGPNRDTGEPGTAMTLAQALKLLRGEQSECSAGD